MPTFEVYIDDDRYSVPSLYLITAVNDARARDIAENLWRDSQHHLGFELCQQGERLYGGGTLESEARRHSDDREPSKARA
jgi:hypothetical protein